MWFAVHYPELMIELERKTKIVGGGHIVTKYKVAPLFHPVNEGKMTGRQGRDLNQQGRRSGVPDLLLTVPRGNYSGLWLEMKAGKKKPETNQASWLIFLEKVGYSAKVCYSYDMAIETITNYMEGSER